MAAKKFDLQIFDLRVIERRLATGEVDSKEYADYLSSLPDDAKQAAWIEVYEDPPSEELTPRAEELTFTSA